MFKYIVITLLFSAFLNCLRLLASSRNSYKNDELMILVTWYLYHTILQYVLLCSVIDTLSFSFWLQQILYEKEMKDSRTGMEKERKIPFIEHIWAQSSTNVYSYSVLTTTLWVGIIPISQMRNQFSDNVDCLLNFSVDINFHLFTFLIYLLLSSLL